MHFSRSVHRSAASLGGELQRSPENNLRLAEAASYHLQLGLVTHSPECHIVVAGGQPTFADLGENRARRRKIARVLVRPS